MGVYLSIILKLFKHFKKIRQFELMNSAYPNTSNVARCSMRLRNEFILSKWIILFVNIEWFLLFLRIVIAFTHQFTRFDWHLNASFQNINQIWFLITPHFNNYFIWSFFNLIKYEFIKIDIELIYLFIHLIIYWLIENKDYHMLSQPFFELMIVSIMGWNI